MSQNKQTSYRDAGVDTKKADSFVSFIESLQKQAASAKPNSYVPLFPSRMNFAALMDLSFLSKYKQALLVTAADGVGSKLHLAQLFSYYKGIGIDLVAMCINDILCSGAKSLQFLDYIACGQIEEHSLHEIMKSIMQGCLQGGCTLAGGETAEHPHIMAPQQYDLAGFAVGIIEAEKLIDGRDIAPGDCLLSLPSSGVHSNGISLIRTLYLKDSLHLPDSQEDRDFLFTQILQKATLIYEPVLRELLDEGFPVKGIVHITGGAFFENIPRILEKNLAVQIYKDSWERPALFRQIAKRAKLPLREMMGIFNMGVGMALFVSEKESAYLLEALRRNFAKAYPEETGRPERIGRVSKRVPGAEAVVYG